MPYHRLIVSYISKEFGLRCLVASFLATFVLIYYLESTDSVHQPFNGHLQNAETFTWTESSTLETPTVILNVTQYNYTCGSTAARRGLHQKVIGFSIYGDFSNLDIVRQYLLPFREILKSIPSVYPDWVVRIHHNLVKDDEDHSSWTIFQKILEFGSHVDLCNVTETMQILKINSSNIFAMTWRWLPLLDEMVDCFMSRDSDSLIVVPREQDAVREWLASNETFHIMKDHPAHCSASMLGGMWGVKVSDDRPRIMNAFNAIFSTNHESIYGYDQSLLTDYIWPIAKSSVVAHDSYCCYNSSLSRPFPSKRSENMLFIGGRGKWAERLRWPCPPLCRPANVTPQWIFC